MKRLILVLALVSSACAIPASVGGRSTAQLTTPGIVALHGVEVVKALDIVRDTAIDAEAAKILPTATVTKIVKWHKAALDIIRSTPGDWKPSVLAGLDVLKKELTPSELSIVGPYIESAIFLIKAVI